MRVRVRLDGRRPRAWHAALLRRIADLPGVTGLTVGDVPSRDTSAPDAWPGNAALLFRLEALVLRVRPAGSRALDPAELAPWRRADPAPDLTIDLCGDAGGDSPIWRIAYDGRVGEAGLLAGLLAGGVPHLAVTEGRRVVAAGRLGTDRHGSVLGAFDDGLARTVTLVAAALRDRLAGLAASVSPDDRPAALDLRAPDFSVQHLCIRAARMLAGAIAGRLYHLCYRAPHWRTGWRRLDGPDLIDLRAHPETGWRVLPDDGRRFYADPFPLAFGGTTHLFVEDFPHATGKGIVSAVRFGPDGPEGAPRPVLETGHHLSYPFVFAREGAAWMIPESADAGTVDLYRAHAYPGGWVREATLLSGIAASDATLLEHAGRWWLFATVRDAPPGAPLGLGSFCDALHVWSAPDFRGPFTPLPGNPVLIDPATARPAGRVVARGGSLMRPVQDCAAGYGRALALARIDRLDAEGFAQTVVARITAGPAWPGSRIHTLNADGGIECIDGSARAPRVPGLPGG